MSDECSICDHLFSEPPLKIKEYSLSTLFLQEDQFFPGICTLISKRHITETFELGAIDRASLMEEINQAGHTLYKAFQPDKINYAFLGNKEPHMHWHIIPRWKSDPFWPEAIWARPHEPLLLSQEEYKKRIDHILDHLSLD